MGRQASPQVELWKGPGFWGSWISWWPGGEKEFIWISQESEWWSVCFPSTVERALGTLKQSDRSHWKQATLRQFWETSWGFPGRSCRVALSVYRRTLQCTLLTNLPFQENPAQASGGVGPFLHPDCSVSPSPQGHPGAVAASTLNLVSWASTTLWLADSTFHWRPCWDSSWQLLLCAGALLTQLPIFTAAQPAGIEVPCESQSVTRGATAWPSLSAPHQVLLQVCSVAPHLGWPLAMPEVISVTARTQQAKCPLFVPVSFKTASRPCSWRAILVLSFLSKLPAPG